ncbi:TonB-dependent receptor plug domain-containing protein [Pedobacter sp. AW1-32]|uniref:TonB-dependent receptor plug domain-containing protein n=1 Tax=Pedobacter sp. AW1-32 TaxID=3383026 RepID=UPI003FEDB2D1
MKIYTIRFYWKKTIRLLFIDRYIIKLCHRLEEKHPFNPVDQSRQNPFLLKQVPLVSIAILLACICSFSSSYAQEITIKRDKVPLERILQDLEAQTDFVFFYKKQDIDTFSSVSLDVTKVQLTIALQKLLEGLNLEYDIFNKTIALKKVAGKGKVTRKIPLRPARLMRGTVVDENEIPIAGAKVKDINRLSSAITDDVGRFTLTIGEKGTIEVTFRGYPTQIIHYMDTTEKYIVLKKGKEMSIELDDVSINYDQVKKNPTKFVDLTNRSYMNLSQILQGTIPGLSLQTVNANTVTVTSVDVYAREFGMQYRRMSVEEFTKWVGGAAKAQSILDGLLKGQTSTIYKINTTTSVISTLVPQIRGTSNFVPQNSNMLVVIDGFPQEGFPANYPMMNVESIEVIKDPKELIKWGPAASGGAILIKTKSAKKGRINISYSNNFSYSPAVKFDREKLQLASSAEYLQYVKEMFAIYPSDFNNSSLNLTPAQTYLTQRKSNMITETQFNQKWDSLSRLDNQAQLALLSQDRFAQNHNLILSGGSNVYGFTLAGSYIKDQSNALNNKTETFSLNLNNDFRLFNNKLKIKWLINLQRDEVNTGYSFSPTDTSLEPYQMLLDAEGNYVYDYTSLSESANKTIMGYGYKNYGVNILEDARANQNTSDVFTKKTSLNANWNLLPGLTWGTSIYYTGKQTNAEMLYGRESSYVRQLVDRFGEISGGNVNFYVPYGDILQQNSTDYTQYNLRTNLSFAKTIGKHGLSIGLGVGAASTKSSRPARETLYGYNQTTGTSTPVYLPTPAIDASITNFYSLIAGTITTQVPYSLTVPVNGDTTISRNINANAQLEYRFSDFITISGGYNRVLNPVYGQDPPYSVMETYNGDITWKVVKNWGKLVKGLYVSTGVNSVKMPDLPVQYNNLRYQQTNFNNYAIWVTGLNPTQQQGQSSNNIYQRLTASLIDSAVSVNIAYNTQRTVGNLQSLNASDTQISTQKSNYLSAGIVLSLRKRLFNLDFKYSKSPEGIRQYNGSLRYDIAKERYFYSNTISAFEVGASLQNTSSYQAMALMMGTNVATNGSFSQANVSDFSSVPPRNTTYEIRGRIAMNEDRYSLDVRYYNQTSAGVNNYLAVPTDPATGTTSQTTYSSLNNKGVELFLKTDVIRNTDFTYSVTLNGAYNRNVVTDVPSPAFTATSSYTKAYRSGYDVTGVWTLPWAGLSATGEPQYYDASGKVSSRFDSASVASSLVYAGVTKAPWTGGVIQEVRYRAFFCRAAVVFNLGYLMRYYIPYVSAAKETSALVTDRWRQPGDEQFTDVAAASTTGLNGYRQFVAQYSSNSLLPADNIRLQEIMVGANVPGKWVKKYGLSSLTVTCSVQNVFTWAKNKYNIDPVMVGNDGRPGLSMPKVYSANVNLSF